ncbi:MAG: FG-GAP-like repeat-containing protein [Candidatus Entotheonellia bacterium]
MRIGRTRERGGRGWDGSVVLGVWLVGVVLAGGPADAVPTVVWQWEASGEDGMLGHAVAGVGDVDGDGVPDVVVTTSSGAGGAGSVSVFSGASGQRLWRVAGELGEQLGYAVAGIGDVNGDGVPDVVVGAPFTAPGGVAWAGSVYMFSGVDGRLLWRVDGVESGDQLGYAVAGVGDVDGDGRPEIVVGAPYASRPGHRGEAYLVSFQGAPAPAGVPDLSLDRDHIDFGTVRLDRSTAPRGFTLRNDGGVPLRITRLAPHLPFYLDVFTPKAPFTIEPGHMEVIYVAFSPWRAGEYREELQVRSTDPDTPVVVVTLTGRARKKRSR